MEAYLNKKLKTRKSLFINNKRSKIIYHASLLFNILDFKFSNESFVNGVTEFVQNTYIDCLNMASSADWALLAEKFPNLANDINSTYEQIARYNNFLGLNIGDSPTNIIADSFATGSYLVVVAAFMIPLLAGLTQWLNVKLAPGMENQDKGKNRTADTMSNTMSTMNMIMPLMSAWFCFSFPSGIGIYWIAGAVVRGVQQVAVNKYIDKNLNFEELLDKNKAKADEKAKKRSAKNAMMLEQAEMMRQANYINTKQIDKAAVANKATKMNEAEREAKMKEVEKYAKPEKDYKKGSIAAKANLVSQYNESKK